MKEDRLPNRSIGSSTLVARKEYPWQCTRRVRGISGLSICHAMLMVSNAYAAVSIADEPPSSGSTSPPAAAQSSGEQTLARFDKNHPLKIGAQYYPPESKR